MKNSKYKIIFISIIFFGIFGLAKSSEAVAGTPYTRHIFCEII
jgi:hypothetical protein